MCAANNPIKIQVIDEDEELESKGAKVEKPKKAKKAKTTSVKKANSKSGTKTLSSKKTSTKKAASKTTKKKAQAGEVEIVEDEHLEQEPVEEEQAIDKKKIVSEEIEADENLEEVDNSFALKLKKELGEDSSASIDDISQKSVIMSEAVDDLTAQEDEIIDDVSDDLVPENLSEEEDDEIQEIVQMRDKNSRSVGIYRRIAYFFAFLVLVMAAVILYFFILKVTIVLVPDQERISNNLIFDVRDKDESSGASRSGVEGIVKSVSIEHEKDYPSTGSEVIGKEAVGKATIINNYSKSQMLVATTRLLAASGELFRLKNTVNVPAGGQAEVSIYADEPGPESAIGPSKFSIPGLWAGLQDKIYAESTEDVVYQQKVKKHVVQSDIDNAIKDMRQQLLLKAKTEINKTYSDYDEIIYDLDDDSIESSIDAEPGDEIDSIVANMNAEVIVVAFEGDDSSKLAEQKFSSSLDDKKELISFDKANIIYSLNNFNSSDGIATINATFEGKVSLKENSNIFEKEEIYNLNSKQLEVYLEELEDISGFEVRFQPAFLPEFLKNVPKLPERIEIEVKK